jgi:hypothetical protein
VRDPRLFEPYDLEPQIEATNDELAALLIAGDHHAAAWMLEGLRELVWQQRAAEVRGRRHTGPRLRSVARRAGLEDACRATHGALALPGLRVGVGLVGSHRPSCGEVQSSTNPSIVQIPSHHPAIQLSTATRVWLIVVPRFRRG